MESPQGKGWEKPWWLADIAVLAAAWFVCQRGVLVDTVKLPFTTRFVPLGAFAVPLTMLWLWLVTRALAATNRLPGLTCGLTGLVSFTLFLVALMQPQMGQGWVKPFAAGLALAGVGGWAASRRRALPTAAAMALGFAVAVVSVAGALKNTAFLMLLFPMLLLGAPLLDVTYAIVSHGSERHGGRFTLTQRRERLHETLLRHQLSATRVTLIYLVIEAYLCVLALLLVAMIRWHFLIKLGVLGLWGGMGFLFFLSIVKVLMKAEPMGAAPERVNLLNVNITPVSMQEAVARIEAFIRSRQPHIVVTSDASAIMKAQTDDELHRIINAADLVTPDGIGVIWGARLLDLPIYERVPGVDLLAALCEVSAQRGYRVFLLGAAPGVAEEAAKNLQAGCPGLTVAGIHHGYFEPEEEAQVIEEIRAAQPDILFVAFGIPKQEKWISQHLAELNVPVCIGVGGSFDVYSGRLRRAPLWMQRIGMEWLYRALKEPRRFVRLLALPKFMLMTLRSYLTRGGAATHRR